MVYADCDLPGGLLDGSEVDVARQLLELGLALIPQVDCICGIADLDAADLTVEVGDGGWREAVSLGGCPHPFWLVSVLATTGVERERSAKRLSAVLKLVDKILGIREELLLVDGAARVRGETLPKR
jgi:hypothetical protein